MSLLNNMNISASGLTAQRLRMDTISNNIANANSTETEEGGAYRRQKPVFAERLQEELGKRSRFNNKSSKARRGNKRNNTKTAGVNVKGVIESEKPLELKYNPDHPHANEDGYVEMPNVNIVEEMTDMISATRAYEANVTAVDASKNMFNRAIQIG